MDQVVILSQFLLTQFHLGNFHEVLSFLHPDIIWTESFHSRPCYGYEATALRLHSLTWLPVCRCIQDTYTLLFNTGVQQAVYADLELTADGILPSKLCFDERATLIWTVCDTPKLLHLHLSLPGELLFQVSAQANFSFLTEPNWQSASQLEFSKDTTVNACVRKPNCDIPNEESLLNDTKSELNDFVTQPLGKLESIGGFLTALFHAKMEQLSEQLQKDSLTGIYLRGRFCELASRCLLAGGGSYFILDMDNFKQINDTMGHAAGDQALQLVAELLIHCLGDYGILGRIGGDEFAVFLPEITAYEVIRHHVENLMQQFHKLQKQKDVLLNTSLSIGIAIAPQDASDLNTLLIKADRALYRVKKNTKDSYQFYK